MGEILKYCGQKVIERALYSCGEESKVKRCFVILSGQLSTTERRTRTRTDFFSRLLLSKSAPLALFAPISDFATDFVGRQQVLMSREPRR
jgi:hypothetical protein